MKSNMEMAPLGVLVGTMFVALSFACDGTVAGFREGPPPDVREPEVRETVAFVAPETTADAQKRLRHFKFDASATLASLDAKLERLKAHSNSTEPMDEPTGWSAHDLAQRRDQLGREVDELVIDGRSRWDELKAQLRADIDQLKREIDEALHATDSSTAAE